MMTTLDTQHYTPSNRANAQSSQAPNATKAKLKHQPQPYQHKQFYPLTLPPGEIRVPYANERLDQFLKLSPEELAKQLPQPDAKPDANVDKDNDADKKKDQAQRKSYGLAALSSNSPRESKLRTIGQYALAATNAGIFTQNIMSMTRSSALDQTPQIFNLLGSSVNLASCFLPMPLKMPAFVAGTSLFMGGTALGRSHYNQAAVPQVVREDRTFKDVAIKTKWNSAEFFPHPDYMRPDKNGNKTFGFMHRAHPGAMAQLARNQYFKTYHKVNDALEPKLTVPALGKFSKALPSSIASTIGGIHQLGWMTAKMFDLNFAHDALSFVNRQEFLKGTKFEMPAAPEYALALGAVLPVTMLAGSLGFEGVKKMRAKHQAEALGDDSTNNQPPKPEDPFSRKPTSTVKMVANASSIIPQVANLMFLPLIRKEATGKPIHIRPSGTGLQHAITPRLNANLIQAGSYGSIASAAVSTLSDVGLMPRYMAYLGDIMFMASSGLTSSGLMRSLFEDQFRITQAAHLFSTPNAWDHMAQVVEAEHNGNAKRTPKGRIPKGRSTASILEEVEYHLKKKADAAKQPPTA
jgi:hypothetical protein